VNISVLEVFSFSCKHNGLIGQGLGLWIGITVKRLKRSLNYRKEDRERKDDIAKMSAKLNRAML
jgi:hypothetical protein